MFNAWPVRELVHSPISLHSARHIEHVKYSRGFEGNYCLQKDQRLFGVAFISTPSEYFSTESMKILS